MTMRGVFCTVLFAVGYLGAMEAQEAPIPHLSPGSARKPAASPPTTPSSPQSIALSVPRGTPLQVGAAEGDGEVRRQRSAFRLRPLLRSPLSSMCPRAHHYK